MSETTETIQLVKDGGTIKAVVLADGTRLEVVKVEKTNRKTKGEEIAETLFFRMTKYPEVGVLSGGRYKLESPGVADDFFKYVPARVASAIDTAIASERDRVKGESLRLVDKFRTMGWTYQLDHLVAELKSIGAEGEGR